MPPLAAAADQGMRILVVEDDPDDARVTFGALRRSGNFSPRHVRSAGEALEAVGEDQFGAFLVDYRLPDLSGVELCRRLRQRGLTAPVILLSSVHSDDVVQRALAAGACEFMVKDLAYGDTLAQRLDRALEP